MHFKRKIREKVYAMYLGGTCLIYIAFELKLDVVDIDVIIDYMNEIHNQ